MPAPPTNKPKVTYRKAGVDIGTGNALVQAIGPLTIGKRGNGAPIRYAGDFARGAP